MDFNRDQWGRPLVIPAKGGKPTAYRRFSSIGGNLEDRFGLEKWKLRTAGKGITERPDLYAQIAACPADDARRLDRLMESALEAGGSTVGAGLGTALHEFAENFDKGLITVEQIPEPWCHDIAAYAHKILDFDFILEHDLVEVTLVNDELRLAGTADRFLRRHDGTLVCADLKCGKSIGTNPLGYIVQIAAYANAVRYDVTTGERSPIGAVDTTIGYLIHLPSGKATCELYEVDLVAGLEAARLAVEVADWQKRKNLVTLVSSPTHGRHGDDAGESTVEATPAPVLSPVDTAIEIIKDVFPGAKLLADTARVDWARERAKTIVGFSPAAADSLGRNWPDGVATFRNADHYSVEELDAIVAVLDRIEAEHGMPFGAPDPTIIHPQPVTALVAPVAPKQQIDEGPAADDQHINSMRGELDELNDAQQQWIGAMTREAAAAGLPLSLKQNPSLRRLRIAQMLIRLANYDHDVATAIIRLVEPTVDTSNTGRIIGGLTIDAATRIAAISAALDEGDLTLGFEDNGTPVIRGDLSVFMPKAA